MKKKSISEIKKMIILVIVIIVLTIIALLIFLSNVDIKDMTAQATINQEKASTNEQNYIYTGLDNANIITSEENKGATYNLTSCDFDATYQVILDSGKVYFEVLDEDKFLEKYPDSEIDMGKQNQIALHNYNIKGIYIGKIDDKDYLLTVTDKATIGIMDIEEAVNNNVFRIKNELISFDAGVSRVENAIRKMGEKVEKTAIIITSDGKNYDLSNFVK